MVMLIIAIFNTGAANFDLTATTLFLSPQGHIEKKISKKRLPRECQAQSEHLQQKPQPINPRQVRAALRAKAPGESTDLQEVHRNTK